MPKFNLGWLKDKNGEKFAPKTFTTQVLDDTGKKNLNEILDNKIDSPTTAEVGQLLEVEDVDANGKPIKWKAVDAPNNQIQVDWEQNDETQLDYVKNRTHYIEKTYETEVHSGEVNFVYSESGNKYSTFLYTGFGHVLDTYAAGTLIKVVIGDSEFNSSINKNLCIGNPYLTDSSWENTGEEYCICSGGLDGVSIYTTKDYGTCTVRIYVIEEDIHPIDKKFIPNNIPKIESATVGQLLVVLGVDENGNPNSFGAVDNDFAKASDLSSYVKTTQYATTSKAGLVRTSTSYGLTMNGQYIQTYPASTSDISSKSNSSKPLTSNNIDYIVKSGLGNSKLTWTEAEKTKARSVIGAISASDIPDIPEVEPQVQADYGEDNSSSASYIKNKTHYDTRKFVEINERINYGGNNAYGNITSDLYDLFINKTIDGLLVDGKTISYYGEYPKYGYILYELSDNRQLYADINNAKAYVMDNSAFDGSISGTLTVTGSINTGSFKQLDEKYIPDNIPKIATATIGQTLEVESVDEDGKPTKWKAVDKSAGGGGIDKAYVESVEQTTTSTASGGENIVTVTNSDGSTNTIKILNGIDGEDGRDGQTPFIDENGYFTYGDPSGAISRSLLGEVYVTGHRKIQPLAIDYATGIITVDDCSFLPSGKIAYTAFRVCIRKNTDSFYPNNVIPSELYGGIGIEKISDNTLYLYKTTTKIESYVESASIDLNGWYIEYSDKACSGITVNLTEVQYGNHLYVEVYTPCTEVKTGTGLNTNVYDSSNTKYLSNGATDGIRPANADVYTFDSVRSLYTSSVKGNAMPLKYTYDFIIDENYIYVTGKNIVACATADDKIPIYNFTEKAILLKNNGLGKININQGSQYVMIPEGTYIKVWEVHD